MNKKESILFDRLKETGYNPKDVYYLNNFSWHPQQGWWCTDKDGKLYKLGKTFSDSQQKILAKKIELIFDKPE